MIGDHTFAAATRVDSGYPRVHTFATAWPADLAPHRRIGILVLASSADDPLTGPERDVGALLASEPKVAYRETATRHAADDGRILLRQTRAVPFTVANPPAGTSAAAALGLAPGGPLAELVATRTQPFAVNAGAPQALVFSTAPQTLTVAFVQGANEITNLASAFGEVAAVLNRAFVLAGFPVRADFVPVLAPPPPNNVRWRLRLRATGSAGFSIANPPAPANSAVPSLGLAVGPVLGGPPGGPVEILGGMGPFVGVLNVGAPRSIVFTATNSARIELRGDTGEIANLAAATAREVRAVLNRGFAAAQLPIRALVPRVDLWVRRSVTDVDGRPATVAGRQLADVVAEPAAVPAGPARAALFDLVRMHAADRIRGGTDNFLYLRSTNLGNAPQVDGRHRLFRLDMAATPIGTSAIGGAVAQTVPAGASTIVEFTWNPGALPARGRAFVLAVVDHDPDRPLAVPASFASVEELDAFCQRNPNAAYRSFEVAT